MIRALFYKELRYLRPFLFLGVALLLAAVVEKMMGPLEWQSFGDSLDKLPFEMAMNQIILGFALGTALLVREIDDGTLNFLDGLPLTRSAAFAAKIMAAILVLAIYPLGVILLHVLLHLGARESLDHAVHPVLLLTFFGLSMLVTAVGLTFGMLLGFLRYLSWLVLSLCMIGILLLKDKAPSLSALLNTGDLLSLRFTGTQWQLPLAAICTQLGAALLFALLAFGLFQASGVRLVRSGKWQKARRWLLPPLVVLMAVAAIGGFAMLMRREAPKANEGKREGVVFATSAAGHAVSTHYTFSYPATSGGRLAPFIGLADKTFADVAALMQFDGGSPIDVDLAGSTMNHEGTAYHDRIRMNLRGAASMGVLAHETTHIFAKRLAGGESSQEFNGMTVFNEGLARWVENKLVAKGQISEEQELAAAIVSQRRLVTPRQLTDFAAFSDVVDENLKYVLGEALVEQFVLRYGAEAPKTMLQTLAREDFPRDLHGYELWQTAFQLGGYDLDLVLDDYARYLKGLEAKYARRIAALPRPRGSLVRTGDRYEVALRLDLPLPEDALPMVRFRPGKGSGSEQYRTSYNSAEDPAKILAIVPDDMITRGELCFQPGVVYSGVTVFEPWVCLPVSSASGATK
ncbi:MAG: hypothetical protein V4631_05170 [Pseudomonadota bacterium]